MMLNDKIRELRKEKGLTQEQLAEAVGVSTASVSKWETGQAAPELTMLASLADYFQVSVDAMLGHVIREDRMEAMLKELEQLCEVKNYAEAKTVADKLVRSYPNTYKVVEAASNAYSDAYLLGQDIADQKHAIELTKRLFSLTEDKTGAKRLELLSKLASHYETLGDWDMAKKYYTEGNVGRMNDRALSRCLAYAGKHEEAVMEITKIFKYNLTELLADVFQLEQIWNDLGQPEKAEAALQWGCDVLSISSDEIRSKYAVLAVMLHVELAKQQESNGLHKSAETHVRTAVRIARGEQVKPARPEFLEPAKVRVLVQEDQSAMSLILSLLDKQEYQRLLAVAMDEAGK